MIIIFAFAIIFTCFDDSPLGLNSQLKISMINYEAVEDDHKKKVAAIIIIVATLVLIILALSCVGKSITKLRGSLLTLTRKFQCIANNIQINTNQHYSQSSKFILTLVLSIHGCLFLDSSQNDFFTLMNQTSLFLQPCSRLNFWDLYWDKRINKM